jgi:hypothetical protein
VRGKRTTYEEDVRSFITLWSFAYLSTTDDHPLVVKMGSLASPLATLGILSIGDMGLGVARLLIANNYRVITNASDRRYCASIKNARSFPNTSLI